MDGGDSIEEVPGASTMPFGGRGVVLLGPSSQQLRLGPQAEEWVWWQPAPTGEGAREAFEVEIRARIVGTTATFAGGQIPVVSWSDKVGHGQDVWPEPFPMLQNAAPFGQEPFNLPARGMVIRTAARELGFGFRNVGTLDGQPVDETTVKVTFLPVWGGSRQAYTYSQMSFPAPAIGGTPQPFPMTAKEWRLTDARGLPLPALGPSVTFIGLTGVPFGITSASFFGGDWFPIPHDAVAWLPDAPVYAHFRALP